MEDKLLNLKEEQGFMKADNFALSNELTVTITLNEYRYLVTQLARYESANDNLQNRLLDKCNEIDELIDENSDLKDENSDLKDMNKVSQARIDQLTDKLTCIDK